MEYENVFRALNQHNVRYLVAGGVAVILHGYVRMTADLDLIVDLEGENALAFVKVMGGLGYRPRAPVQPESFADRAVREQWIREKGMKVFSYFHPRHALDLVDVFVKEPFVFSEAYRRKKVFRPLPDLPVTVVSLADLKTLKSQAGRDEDLLDLDMLNKLDAL